MKKRLLYSASALLISLAGVSLLLSNVTSSSPSRRTTYHLFDAKGAPIEDVRKVFELLGVSVSSIEQANEFAQKNLLRKGERWDEQEENELRANIRSKKALLLDALRAIGMVDTIMPTQQSYGYALVLGATKRPVEQRLNFLAELKQSGHAFKYIVLLSGERQLLDHEKEGLPEGITTEAQMVAYLCANHPVLKNDAVIMVNVPMIQHNDGSITRPNTDDTVNLFARIAPENGSCLVISNAPYVVRQTKVVQRILDQKRFPTEGAGKKANEETINVITLMDEFARAVYEEYKQTQH